ncbi:MAG TPA: lysylphosphatidylglycerol synthase transmembrane domain-containing protein [Polyangiaceae bacterium]|jgi:uncharacterized membrane protein YbhN (UPF0104 family)|nr:lysylphosphatidylglycerol synthase transmembrane domain-containing protein [Polyangiaceae bacterium]
MIEAQAPLTEQPAVNPPNRLRRIRTVVGSLLAVGFVGFLGHHLWAWHDELVHALNLGPGILGAALLMMLGAHVQRAFEFNYMLRRLSVREDYIESFALTGVALLLNYFPLSAGSAARAVALKQKYDLAYASYVSALIISVVVNAAVAAALAFFMCIAIVPAGRTHDTLVTVFGVAMAGSTLGLLLPTSRVPRGQSFVARHGRQLIEGLRVIRGRGGVLVLIGTSLAKLFFNSVRLWLCFHALGLSLSARDAALLGSAAVTISLVNVVPGNLGLREVLVGAMAGLIGFRPEMGMAAVSLDRAVILAYVFTAGVPSVFMLKRAFAREQKAGSTLPPRA